LFYKLVKLKRSPKNPELDINVAKTGNSTFFCSKQQIQRQMVNSTVWRENGENLLAAEHCWLR